jgi:alanine racemase
MIQQGFPTALFANLEAGYEPCTDTRHTFSPEKTIFFALQGATRDGHDFIGDAIKKGIKHFVIQRAEAAIGFEEVASFYIEPSVLGCLQGFAQHKRRLFSGGPVIGITGSNGKTSVKEWLYELLSPDYLIAKSPKSYNSQIGVPLSVCALRPYHELGIFEAGISEKGEMDFLADIIQPDIGVFTNIGSAHAEGFANDDEKAREKFKLFRHAQTLIYNKSEKLIDSLAQNQTGLSVFTWSFEDNDADLVATYIENTPSGARFQLLHRGGKKETIELPFMHKVLWENAMHCYAILRILEYRMKASKRECWR